MCTTSSPLTVFKGPFDLYRIRNATIRMGNRNGDGTDDDVKIKIASDVDASNSCQVKLSRTFGDDFSKGDNETWPKGQFDECADLLYKVRWVPTKNYLYDNKLFFLFSRLLTSP